MSDYKIEVVPSDLTPPMIGRRADVEVTLAGERVYMGTAWAWTMWQARERAMKWGEMAADRHARRQAHRAVKHYQPKGWWNA